MLIAEDCHVVGSLNVLPARADLIWVRMTFADKLGSVRNRSVLEVHGLCLGDSRGVVWIDCCLLALRYRIRITVSWTDGIYTAGILCTALLLLLLVKTRSSGTCLVSIRVYRV